MKDNVKFLFEDASKVPFAGVGPVSTRDSLTLTWMVTGNFRVTTALTMKGDDIASATMKASKAFHAFIERGLTLPVGE